MRLTTTGLALFLAACGGGGAGTDGGVRSDGGSSSTALPVDCRAASSDVRCTRFSDVAAGSVGTGIAIPGGTGSFYGGFVDAAGNRVVLAGYDSMDQGYVLAIDLTTGNRTVVSGAANDVRTGVQMRGTGPALGHLYDVDRGADGRLYTLGANGVHAIDATTGDRTMIAAGGSAACTHAGMHWYLADDTGGDPPGLAIASDGTLYVPLGGPNSTSDTQSHAGVARIALDGTCTVVSMSSENAAYRLGSGPQATGPITGMAFAGARLYYDQFASGEVISVDVATGARTLVTSAIASVGSGTVSAEQSYVVGFDAATLWTSGRTGSGTGASAVVTVDVATGNRVGFSWDQDGPLGSFDEAWWAYPHPTLPGVAIVGAGLGGLDHGVVLLELATGNHYLLSR